MLLTLILYVNVTLIFISVLQLPIFVIFLNLPLFFKYSFGQLFLPKIQLIWMQKIGFKKVSNIYTKSFICLDMSLQAASMLPGQCEVEVILTGVCRLITTSDWQAELHECWLQDLKVKVCYYTDFLFLTAITFSSSKCEEGGLLNGKGGGLYTATK